jgi:hypothetical protein
VARILFSIPASDEALLNLAGAATELIPGCDAAGVTAAADGGFTTKAWTSQIVCDLDRAQIERDDGPCLEAIRSGPVASIDDVEMETRWRHFCDRARVDGIRSVLGVQLGVDDDTLGALNLYARSPGAFRGRSGRVALLLASHASVALAAGRALSSREHEMAGLMAALRSRDVIGQAKGILMERHRLSADDAFEMLRKVSQERNVKLVTVADELCLTGAFGGATDVQG